MYTRLACALLVAACGEVKDINNLPDGPPAPDGPDVDAAIQPVTVTVLTSTGDGLPDPTATVVFHDADNAVILEGVPDAQGKIQALMPRGGAVSAIRVVTDTTTTLQATITTYTGVKPGDDLTIGRKAIPTITNMGGQTTMTANFTPIAGAAPTYVFHTKCGSTNTATSPATISLRDSCHGATFDLLVTTVGITPARFARVQNIAHASNGVFTIPNGFSTMGNFTINAANTPAEVDSMTFTRSTMFDGAAVGAQAVPFTGDPPAGLVSQVVPFPTAVGTRSNVVVAMSRPDASNQQRHEAMTANLTSTFDVDLATRKLPWLTNGTITPTGVTWTEVAPGDTPDGTLLQWAGRWTDGTKTTTIVWRVAQGAPAAAGVTVPRLPATHARLDPQAQAVAVAGIIAVVLMVDYDNINGYDELRKQADSLFEASPDDVSAFTPTTAWQRRVFTQSFR